jgi:hypothetical protein
MASGVGAMWVLILFYFTAGNPSIAMDDFLDKAACENALAAATAAQPKGMPRVAGVCARKDWLHADEEPVQS